MNGFIDSLQDQLRPTLAYTELTEVSSALEHCCNKALMFLEIMTHDKQFGVYNSCNDI